MARKASIEKQKRRKRLVDLKWEKRKKLKEIILDVTKSDEERQKAAKEYFEKIFGEELKSMKKKGEEKHEKAKMIARMFRFICPSYYMPGKQDWGAF